MFQDQKDIENRLSALGEHLGSLTDEPVELLVCGGSALIVLGFVQRATKDVDILVLLPTLKRPHQEISSSLTPNL